VLSRLQRRMEAGEHGPARATARELLEDHDLPNEQRAPLERFILATAHAESCAVLEAAVNPDAQGRSADKVRQAWDGVRPEDLPEPLRKPAAGLRGLGELNEAAARPWDRPPDVPRLRRALADLRLASGDARGTTAIAQDLSARAFLAGH